MEMWSSPQLNPGASMLLLFFLIKKKKKCGASSAFAAFENWTRFQNLRTEYSMRKWIKVLSHQHITALPWKTMPGTQLLC